jgi:trk system potassium uptake protein
VRRIAVIGLGRFGMSLARSLGELGVSVIAVDKAMRLVNEIKDGVDLAVQLDSTDRDALIAQDLANVDVAIVSIGENFEASLLTTVHLQKLEVPRIICRAQTKFHAEIFHQIGAHEVIQPETTAGEQTARRLANSRLSDVIDVAEGYALVEIKAPESWSDTSLKDLKLRTQFDVNLVAIKRMVKEPGEPVASKREVISVPRPNDQILLGDVLMLVGPHAAIDALPEK